MPVVAWAQVVIEPSGDDVDVTRLDAVSVTAAGYEQSLTDSAAAVAIVTADDFARSNARSVGERLLLEPGISTAVDGSVGFDPIVRGLKRDQVLVLVDGVRVNALQPPSRGSLTAYVHPDLIERAEVVKGPSSVLYGSGAMGGVINIITRSAGFSAEPDTQGFVRFGASSVDRGLRAAAGVAYTDERVVLELQGAGSDADDYRMGNGERLRESGNRHTALYGQIAWQPSDAQTLRLRLQRDRREDVWFLASRTFVPNDTPTQPAGVNTHYAPSQTRNAVVLDYEADLGRALGLVGDPIVKLTAYRQRLDRGNYDFNDRLQRDYRQSDTRFETDGLRGQIEFSPGDRQVVLLGGEAWRLRASPVSFLGLINTDYVPVVRVPLIEDAELESVGVFAQHETYLDAATLNLGLRVDRVIGRAEAAQNVAPPLERKDTTVSWSLGGVWHWRPEIEPYARVSEGYRAASLLERFLTYPYSDGFTWRSDPQLAPERNRAFEIGARGQIDGYTRYAVSLFESRIRDYIGGRVIDGAPIPTKQTVNLTRARVRGVELAIERRVGPATTASLAATWLRADNLDPAFSEPLAQTPPPEAVVGLRYAPPRGWQADAQLRAVSRQSRVGTRFTGGTERSTSGFATVDLGFGFAFGDVGGLRDARLRFAVENLFDRAYREHVNELTEARLVAGGGRVQDLLRPGRNLSLVFDARF